jgi:hypothetical protein
LKADEGDASVLGRLPLGVVGEYWWLSGESGRRRWWRKGDIRALFPVARVVEIDRLATRQPCSHADRPHIPGAFEGSGALDVVVVLLPGVSPFGA